MAWLVVLVRARVQRVRRGYVGAAAWGALVATALLWHGLAGAAILCAGLGALGLVLARVITPRQRRVWTWGRRRLSPVARYGWAGRRVRDVRRHG